MGAPVRLRPVAPDFADLHSAVCADHADEVGAAPTAGVGQQAVLSRDGRASPRPSVVLSSAEIPLARMVPAVHQREAVQLEIGLATWCVVMRPSCRDPPAGP